MIKVCRVPPDHSLVWRTIIFQHILLHSIRVCYYTVFIPRIRDGAIVRNILINSEKNILHFVFIFFLFQVWATSLSDIELTQVLAHHYQPSSGTARPGMLFFAFSDIFIRYICPTSLIFWFSLCLADSLNPRFNRLRDKNVVSSTAAVCEGRIWLLGLNIVDVLYLCVF